MTSGYLFRWFFFSSSTSTFASLTDTPSELSAGKYIKVNDAGDGIEFVDAPSGGSSSVVTHFQLKVSLQKVVEQSTNDQLIQVHQQQIIIVCQLLSWHLMI